MVPTSALASKAVRVLNSISSGGAMSDIRPRTACGQPVLNAILQQLPEAEFESLRPYLEFQEFRIAHCLLQQGSSIRAVYFLNSGVASMILETPNARSVEIGLSGC